MVQGCTRVHNQSGHAMYIKWVEEQQKNEELAAGRAKKSTKGTGLKVVAMEVNEPGVTMVPAVTQPGITADIVAQLQHVIVGQNKKHETYKCEQEYF